ncbi:MAG: hypothetical protein WBA12_01805, partial [Catalinimonas sp.]
MPLFNRYRSLFISTLLLSGALFAEGSKNLTPTNSGSANGTNQFIGYLQHDDAANSNNFLKPNASPAERLYVRMLAGEALYYGVRRIGNNDNFGDLVIVIRDNAGNEVDRDTLRRNSGNSAALAPGPGVIGSYAEAAAGPRAEVGASGYNALTYTNNTGSAQNFYVEFYQTRNGSVYTLRSWYDLWDFSVYNNGTERPGRLHAQTWSFTAGSGSALLSTEFQLFARVPSPGFSGSYVKEIDLKGIRPFGMLVYANSTGADPTLAGTTDFKELRKSRTNNSARAEYELFVNNPDIDVYPTSELPEVSISDVNAYCNPTGGGASGVVLFESGQRGFVAIVVDLDGTAGYQTGTEDVIIEAEITTPGRQAVRWNGRDGLGNNVPSGQALTISGRFTSGPLHVPLWDVEGNNVGLSITDVRPRTTFDLIYWDDSNTNLNSNLNSNPETELDGTNTVLHTWGNGNEDLINTWSFGFLALNTNTRDYEYTCDFDGDGLDDGADADTDNDGIPNSVEGDYLADHDGDDIPNYLDPEFPGFNDRNGDGIDDQFDADLDGLVNSLDLDSDNDGLPDGVEANGGAPRPLMNADGQYPPGTADGNGDGLVDDAPNLTRPDTDQDGLADYLDLDSDGDGIVDVIEAGGTAGKNGTVAHFTDTNRDGLHDPLATNPLPAPNFGGGGSLRNYRDLDSDNDGITDNREAQLTFAYVAPSATDADGDGLADGFDPDQGGTLIEPRDSDDDGAADYLDLDSDDDEIPDQIEGHDADGDGRPDWDATGNNNDPSDEAGFNADSDGDGIRDLYDNVPGGAAAGVSNVDGSNADLRNTDGDTFEDYRDDDDDNDGLATAGEDNNNNGDWSDDRTQGGGTVPDYLYAPDFDGDGVNDITDADSDNDGILDRDEAGGQTLDPSGDQDGDGVPNFRDPDLAGSLTSSADLNGDGIYDVYDRDR